MERTGSEAWRRSYLLAQALRRTMEVAVGLLPAAGIAYLYYFQDPELLFENHAFHEATIGIASLIGGLVAYVSWRCYRRSGEPFVKWLTRGFIGFTLVYSLHGFFTPLAGEHPALFILYGPASRLLMAACLFVGILRFGEAPESGEERRRRAPWFIWVALCCVVNGLVGVLAHQAWAGVPLLRNAQESAAALLCGAGLLLLYRRRQRSPLLAYHLLALAYFAFSSLAFMLGKAWNHQWWQAHAIFAVGFFLLGYGVLRAYLTTRSCSEVFSAQESFDELAASNRRLHRLAGEAQQARQQLEARLAAAEQEGTQFRTLFEISPDAILLVSRGGEILDANPPAFEMFRYPPGQLAGRMVEELMPAGMRAWHVRHRELYEYAGGTRSMGGEGRNGRSFDCLRGDGSLFAAVIQLGNVVIAGRPCAVVFIRTTGELLDEAAGQLPGMLFRFRRGGDGQYDFPFVSRGVEEMLEVGADELSRNPGLLFARVHPADLPGLLAALERAAAGETPWNARWRANLPGAGVCGRALESSPPQRQADGSMLWTGYLRAAALPKTEMEAMGEEGNG